MQGLDSYELEVPVETLTSILDCTSYENFDFMSLDVEGFELEVLKGLDFSKYHPTSLLVEINQSEELRQYLANFYRSIDRLSPRDELFRWKK